MRFMVLVADLNVLVDVVRLTLVLTMNVCLSDISVDNVKALQKMTRAIFFAVNNLDNEKIGFLITYS